MLLPPFADLMVLGLAAVSLFGTVAYVVRGGRLLWVVVGGGAMTLGFGVLAGLLIAYGAPVIRVTGESTPRVERQLLVFGTTLTLDGKDFTVSSRALRTLVINETSRPLTLRGEVYSMVAGSPAQPPDVTIAPRSVLPWPAHVDHVGPDEPLPREVSASATETTVTKYWLTW